MIILVVLAMPVFRSFQKESVFNDTLEEIISALRLAQNKTLASEGDSQWGVYFSISTVPHQYTLFKGSDYDDPLRDDSFDEIHELAKAIEIYEISLTGGKSEIVFNRLTGTTNQNGKVSLRLKDDISKNKTVSIQLSGQIILGEETLPTDMHRIKDSRHVHFNYSRNIDIDNEIITLTFPDPDPDVPDVTEEIKISDYLKDGQIDWEGRVDIGEDEQVLHIHTHELNNPHTQFCIHRDRRYNNKSLKINIVGDGCNYSISYTADGLITHKDCSYVYEQEWQ